MSMSRLPLSYSSSGYSRDPKVVDAMIPLLNENESLRIRVDELVKQKRTDELVDAQRKIALLEERLRVMEQSLDSARKQSVSQVEKARAEQQRLELRLADSENKLEYLKSENSGLKSSISKSDQRNSKLGEELQAAKNKLFDAQQSISQMVSSSEVQSLRSELEQQRLKFVEEKAAISSERDRLALQIESTKAENTKLLASMKAETDRLHSDRNAEVSRLETRIADVQSSNDVLRSEKASLTEKISQLDALNRDTASSYLDKVKDLELQTREILSQNVHLEKELMKSKLKQSTNMEVDGASMSVVTEEDNRRVKAKLNDLRARHVEFKNLLDKEV